MEFAQPLDHGTTHISIIDENEMAVSLTSTINLIFGSQLMDPETGVIFNDQMDDFSIPNRTNYFGYPPSPNNFIEPGKRPQSSASPIIIERDGRPFIVTGASGGSYIISSVVNTILNVILGLDASSAVNKPRLHHQLYPNILYVESDFNRTISENLMKLGHNITFSKAQSAVQLIVKNQDSDGNDFIEAVSDPRKNGVAAGE